MTPQTLLRSLWRSSPKQNLRKVARRLAGPRTADVEDLLQSPKHARPQRAHDYLSRYETIVRRLHDWPSLDFVGKAVLEVGCGPMVGFAPLAVFAGCETFVGVDPDCDPAILRHAAVRERFLLRFFKDAAALYGTDLTFDSFLDRLDKRVVVLRRGIGEVASAGRRFDVVLSNSTLEHLEPLEPAIARLRDLHAPRGRFLHLVDFGNHRDTRNPFAGMYSVEPDAYRGRHGRGINLARAPDIMRIFAASGFDAMLAPYYSFPELYDEVPVRWWRERYTDADLFLKAALVVGSA